MEKISIRDLSFRYPLAERDALAGVNLDLAEAEFMVLCGKSGCGKSTLLRHLKKSLVPYGEKRGEVFYEGIPVEEMDDRRAAAEIGFVLQNPETQIVTDKVWHELAFGLESLGYGNEVIRRRVAEMASYFGIQNWFRKDVSELSGGQKQMLNLASVMAMQPQVLILDEPTSQLDPIAAQDFLTTVYQINRDLGVTVLISEHRLETVFPYADRVTVMDRGGILASAPPRKIAAELAVYEDGRPHPMYYGMPDVMRIFPPAALKETAELPLTQREGRLRLENLLAGREEEARLPYAGPETETDSKADHPHQAEKDREPVLRMKNVWFRYDRRGDDVLRGLDLDLPKGAITCLLGGNGSGKTTTLKALIGIIKPQRGKIQKDPAERVAMVPQDPQALFTEITSEEEVLEGMAYLPLTDEEKVQRVREMLGLMEISHLAKANPYDLSGGEQQRLALAKVLACGPDILLLDEPTKGLDPFFKRSLGTILRRLAAQGKTIFLVSHDVEFCARFGDRCALFFDGIITASGSAREFFRGNSFYTTMTNKLVRAWQPDLILPEEANAWLAELL